MKKERMNFRVILLPIILSLTVFFQSNDGVFAWIYGHHHRSSSFNSHNRYNSKRLAPLFHGKTPTKDLPKRTKTSSNENEDEDCIDKNEEELRGLYPPSTSFRNGTLQVDEIHCLEYSIHGKKMEKDTLVPEGSSNQHKRPPLMALFLHGGPGAGSFPNHARFFDPDRYQIVLLDQRGSGKSTPRGETRNNTLLHLVEDCETLRKTLEIPRWDVVLGGSWGTTLAIAYALSFPTSIRSLILRGVCLLRQQEVDWLFSSTGGAAKQNPQAWKAFEQVALDSEGTSLKGGDINNGSINPRRALHACYQKFMGNNLEDRRRAARAWMTWEYFVSVSHKLPASINISDTNATMKAINNWNKANMVSPVAVRTSRDEGWCYQDAWGNGLTDYTKNIGEFRQGLGIEEGELWNDFPIPYIEDGNETTSNSTNSTAMIPAQSMLTCFYATNCGSQIDLLSLISQEQQQLDNIPCVAIQGGSDRICPPDTALDVCDVWPTMELRMPLLSGHSMYDPFITHELVRATDRMADRFFDEDASTKET